VSIYPLVEKEAKTGRNRIHSFDLHCFKLPFIWNSKWEENGVKHKRYRTGKYSLLFFFSSNS
jgi:hypothetical protein